MKILNLYAGIGGNRRLWGDDHEITAVEYDPVIASIYADHFPKDKVLIRGAHEYLLHHFEEYDFIWASPPCQTHTRLRTLLKERVYPEMSLYQEIIFLKHWFKGGWVVENVIPYYKPLIEPTFEFQRHYFWSNFDVEPIEFEREKFRQAQIPQLQKLHGFDLSGYKVKNKRQVLRNCVYPPVGKHILESYD